MNWRMAYFAQHLHYVALELCRISMAIYGYVVRYCILTFRIATIPGGGRNSSNIRGQMNEWPSFSTCQTSLLILPEMTLSGTSLFLRFLSPVETEAPISKTPSLLEINKIMAPKLLLELLKDLQEHLGAQFLKPTKLYSKNS